MHRNRRNAMVNLLAMSMWVPFSQSLADVHDGASASSPASQIATHVDNVKRLLPAKQASVLGMSFTRHSIWNINLERTR
jgi:hypothetical protein